jgi:uncharacterized protein (DUF1684 family)
MLMKRFISDGPAHPAFPGHPAFPALIALAIALALSACSNKPPENKDYASRLAGDRQAKDKQFMEEDEPVPKSRKGKLLPLSYFPIDPDYNVPSALTPAASETIVDMPTSTGLARRTRIVGTLEFVVNGQPLKLTASVDAEAQNLNHITVMFTDLTSGSETYPGGRYIDLDRNGSGIYELDFNRAYNPYCYYNESYECPYPPPENRLKVPIRVGERLKVEGKG